MTEVLMERVNTNWRVGNRLRGRRIHSTTNIWLLIGNGQHAIPVKTALFRVSLSSATSFTPPSSPCGCSWCVIGRSASRAGLIGGCDTSPWWLQWHLRFTQDDSQRHKHSMGAINYKGFAMDTHIFSMLVGYRTKNRLGNLRRKKTCLACESQHQRSWKNHPVCLHYAD